MIAVVEIGGNQFTIQKGDVIEVDHVDSDAKTLTVEPLLVSDEEGKNTVVGTPTLPGHQVTFKVLDQKKGEKMRIFKMKSKKRYTRTMGFRRQITVLKATTIS